MSNPDLFSQHFLDSSFQLLVVAIDIIFRSVVNFDVRIELCVLSKVASHVSATYLWDAKDQGIVDECFPPHGGHGAGNWCTNQFSDAQLLVHEREAVPIAVVIFTHHDARRLSPFVPRVFANELSAWDKALILLA